MTNIDKTLAERGSRYGDFPDHAQITQSIKDACQGMPGWLNLADDQKEAIDMIAHKMGRIVNGDPNYIDSWTDIIGYARLVEKRLIDEQENPAQMSFAFESNQDATFGPINTEQEAPTKQESVLKKPKGLEEAFKEAIEAKKKASMEFDEKVRRTTGASEDPRCNDPDCWACHSETAAKDTDPLLAFLQKVFGPDVRRA